MISPDSPISPQAPLWNSIDAVLVLNLDHRAERWEQLQQETAGVIPSEKLHRVSAVLGRELPDFGQRPWSRGRKRDATWAARGGCVLAHRRALETARSAGWQWVLILEDDVALGSDFIANLDALQSALFASSTEWDVCYLGYTDPQGPFQTVAPLAPGHHLSRVFGCNCAHAYLIHAAARDWVLGQLPSVSGIWRWLTVNRAIDRWYRKVLGRHFRILAVSPSLINQRDGFSDIVGRQTDYTDGAGHVLAIPDIRSSPSYGLRYFLKSLSSCISQTWDFARSIRKCLAGF
jgi:GR25 family glycosyltransferase involved in LPS biosynthesis